MMSKIDSVQLFTPSMSDVSSILFIAAANYPFVAVVVASNADPREYQVLRSLIHSVL